MVALVEFERDGLDEGSLGLHLEEAKSLLGRLQRTMVTAQVAEEVARSSVCPTCGAQLAQAVSLSTVPGRRSHIQSGRHLLA